MLFVLWMIKGNSGFPMLSFVQFLMTTCCTYWKGLLCYYPQIMSNSRSYYWINHRWLFSNKNGLLSHRLLALPTLKLSHVSLYRQEALAARCLSLGLRCLVLRSLCSNLRLLFYEFLVLVFVASAGNQMATGYRSLNWRKYDTIQGFLRSLTIRSICIWITS